MKKLTLFFVAISLSALLQAGVSKTVNVTTAGTLSTYFTLSEYNTVTNLTVTGNIDARDMYFMRENLDSIVNLDLSACSIVECTASNIYFLGSYTYVANKIPDSAFSRMNFSSILLPTNIIKIPGGTFNSCYNLISILIPETVEEFGNGVFDQCYSLRQIQFNRKIPAPLNGSSGADVLGVNLHNPCYIYVPIGSTGMYSVPAEYGGWGLENYPEFVLWEGTIPVTVQNNVIEKELSISKQGDKTLVSGLTIGESLSVYNIYGQSCFSDTVNTESIALSLPSPGVYIIKTANSIEKIVI